ncbi:hypothetical protein MD484_g2535, partial [Candolleomyces efflorescens]
MPPVYLLQRRAVSYPHGIARWKRAGENEDPVGGVKEPSSLGDLATVLTDAELPPSLSSRGSGALETTSATDSESVFTTPDVALSSVVITATLETSIATENPDIFTTPGQQAPTTVVISLPQILTTSVTTQDPTRTAETEGPLPVETSTPPVLVTDDPLTSQTPVVKPAPQASAVPPLESTSSEEPIFTSLTEPQAPSFTARPTGASTPPNTSKTTPEPSPSSTAPLPTTITQAEPTTDATSNPLTRTEVSGTTSQTLDYYGFNPAFRRE